MDYIEDPLARSVRRKLKKRGIVSGIPVVYSTEKPHHVKLLPLGEWHHYLIYEVCQYCLADEVVTRGGKGWKRR
jgi:hypothetical protein